MSYETATGFEAWFSQLNDGRGRLDTYLRCSASERKAKLDGALSAASSEMDHAFSMAGYPVPVSATGNLAALFKRHCSALAVGHLRLTWESVPEVFKDAEEAARDYLKDVRGVRAFNAMGMLSRVAGLDLPGVARP